MQIIDSLLLYFLKKLDATMCSTYVQWKTLEKITFEGIVISKQFRKINKIKIHEEQYYSCYYYDLHTFISSLTLSITLPLIAINELFINIKNILFKVSKYRQTLFS